MTPEEQIDLGRKYQDLVSNSDAFKHLLVQIQEKIDKHRQYLEEFRVHSGNPNEALGHIATIQALNWVLDSIDDEISRGLYELNKAATGNGPTGPQ